MYTKDDFELIRKSGILNRKWYSETYRDVAILGMDPIHHYLIYGAKMGRNPSRKFDTEFYIKQNPKLSKTGDNPLLHYLKIGQFENQSIIPKNHEPIKKNTILAANDIIKTIGFSEGLAFANANSTPTEMQAINILLANENISTPSKWLEYTNRYLSSFNIEPITLNDKADCLYSRIECKTPRIINNGPKISVIMPAFNAEKHIEFAARSILNQTWRNIELIIINDCSDDNTLLIAKKLEQEDSRVIILDNKHNVGPYVSKNYALKIVSGDYVTGHDSDDWAHPERLERHINFMLANKINVSISSMVRITEDGVYSRISNIGKNCKDGVVSGAFISCMFEKKFLQEIFGFWDEVKFAGDSELIRRVENYIKMPITRHFSIGMICLDSPHGLTNDPLHGYSPSKGLSKSRKEYLKNFSEWHNKIDKNTCFLEFPQFTDHIAKPASISVNNQAIKSNLLEHQQSGKFTQNLECDICIVTDLRFKGGNASSTIDEIRYFKSIGKRVKLVHCPTILSQGKDISDRYCEYADDCISFYSFEKIKTHILIVRHPLVITSKKFNFISKKIIAENLAVVINNSELRSNGDLVYNVCDVISAVSSFKCGSKKVFPLGPAIRKELIKNSTLKNLFLSTLDWTPTFDSSSFSFNEKLEFKSPIRIGRHGRDGNEKWLENDTDLLKVYPVNKNYKISILGGADCVKKRLGYLPNNWEVLPFGSKPPQKYLELLDVFVYYPNSGLNEAFGRTIVEALFSGVPCILPPRFRETFGELAIYAEPKDVEVVIERLSSDHALKVNYLLQAREIAVSKYDSSVLLTRIIPDAHTKISSSVIFDKKCLDYKKWVEQG